MNSHKSDRRKQRAPTPQELDALRTLSGQGRYPEAVSLAQRMTVRFPEYAFGWKALAELLRRTGRGVAALAAMQNAAALSPTDSEIHFQLGLALSVSGQLADAEASYRRALQIGPERAEVHNNLGSVLLVLGRPADAEASFRRALQLKPDFAEAHNNLSNVLFAQGRLAEAEAGYRRALQVRPDYVEAQSNLGNALWAQRRPAEAEASYRRALQRKPDLVETHKNLGNVLVAQGQLAQAEGAYRRALQIRPENAEVHNDLGNVLVLQGRLAEAKASHGRALQIKPEFAYAHGNLLMSLNYQPGKPEEIFRAYQEYEARFGTPHHGKWPDRKSRLQGLGNDRRLKVGYVSPDFRQHSVNYFISPLLREHDRHAVEVFCYAEVARPDATTSALQRYADHWVNTVGLPDADLAERIAADEIDILVDLAGHTSGNRLLVFARKPAPIQITWLGYPNTTGLSAIGYRLVDAVTDPPGEADRWASETLIRLDNGFLCFEPRADAPPPRAPACLASGTVTFGSFNFPAKLSPETLDAWTGLLARVPGSRLLLKGLGFAEEATRHGFLTRFAQRGGDPQRVTLLGLMDSSADHLAAYDQVDIALDPFPYNGTTTTCEALWMGVPVVTLLGIRHVDRVGASLLTQVGLTELIAPSVGAYIDIAAALAADPGRLGALRQTMRERMRTSSLCDAHGFARKIEATYRDLWQRYCSSASVA